MGASSSTHNVAILGLDNAGKTTLLYQWRLEQAFHKKFEPSKAFNYEVVTKVYQKRRLDFHMWDLAGCEELRPLWGHFLGQLRPDVLVFVIDANDRERMRVAKKEFDKVVYDPAMHNTVKIILSNVKHIGDECRIGEIRETFGLSKSASESKHDVDQISESVRVFEVNAFEGTGLEDPINYICSTLV